MESYQKGMREQPFYIVLIYNLLQLYTSKLSKSSSFTLLIKQGEELNENGECTTVHAKSANWKWRLRNDATISADAPVEMIDEFLLFVRVRLCILSSSGQAVT